MLCDLCHKNKATVHYTEIVDGKIIKLNMCEGCFKEKEIMNVPFNVSELLAGLTKAGHGISEQSVVCPFCGMKLTDFRKRGKLGCSECYTAFRKQLLPLLKTIHKSSYHRGHVSEKSLPPEEVDSGKYVQELKNRLSECIKKEEYETAALLRDKIREFNNKAKDK
ncbi:MAG: UvrB/UvrC motif-containing protein [Candidatus Aureabacteria bacterium]|nr:UvrB/UvrC motif-containing protein [Candidatus Auribacterota bacterium]MCK5160654.1 UvrB/UvrC motif-containing protein [Candidatus Auribacterota bacterium]MCK5654962.1 UvrB/UvrC motif-containing protein [Candidatus Auribacterota bacterium]